MHGIRKAVSVSYPESVNSTMIEARLIEKAKRDYGVWFDKNIIHKRWIKM